MNRITFSVKLDREQRDILDAAIGDTGRREFIENLITDINMGKLVIENGHIYEYKR